MAEALYLVERTEQPDNNLRDGIRNVIINNDDGDADAVIITNAIAAVNAALPAEANFENKLPAGYFDTVNKVSDLVTTGDLRTDQDFLCYTREVVSVRT
jgi:hypothetical protein